MKELKGDQPKAFKEITEFIDQSGYGMLLLQGYAGTGKTFLSGEIVEYIRSKFKSVLVTAPTHQAVKVLRMHLPQKTECATTYSALGMKEYIDDQGVLSFRRDPKQPSIVSKFSVFIVDEASMVDDSVFAEIVKLEQVKVIFIGDPYQTPPVNYIYAPPFSKQTQQDYEIRIVTLREIIRQAKGSPIIQNATDIRTNIREPWPILNRQEVETEQGHIKHIPYQESNQFFDEVILPKYKSAAYDLNSSYIKVVCWRNKTIDFYNKKIREYLFGSNLPFIIAGDKLITDAPVFEDEKIIIPTNEELLVLKVTIAEETIGGGEYIKYYKAHVRVTDAAGPFNEYMLRIIHEESIPLYEQVLDLQRQVAKSYTPGSYQAKSAWIDYYSFIKQWHPVKYSYCISAHKSQGSTYHTAVINEADIRANFDVFERNRILYTACTRPSNNLFILY